MKKYYFNEEELQARFDEIMDLIDNEGAHVFITRNGEPIVVMVPYEYFQKLENAVNLGDQV